MEFWRLFEQYLRDLHRGVMRRIEAHLAPVHHAIDWWLGDLFEKPLPDDWREQWHALLARMEAEHRVRFDPTSADQVADWIQWWAGRCGLLRTASHSNSVSRFSATALVTVIGPDDRSADEIDNGQPAESEQGASHAIVESTTDREKQLRQLARQIANLEQRRIGLSDDERTQLEFYLLESFRLQVQGNPINAPPDFWLEKDNAYAEKLRAGRQLPSMRGISGEEYERSERDWKLAHPERLNPGEYEVLASLAREEARRKYYSDPNRSFLGLFLDRLLNPAWAGSGNLDDLLGVIGPLGGASQLPRNRRTTSAAQPGSKPPKIPRQLAQTLGKLNEADRRALLARAAAAKNEAEAIAIIKSVLAEERAPKHHIATSRNSVSTLRGGPWTPRFEKMFEKASLTLEDADNIVRLPQHKGPHPQEYHEEIFRRLSDAILGTRGEAYREAMLKELRKIAVEIKTEGTRLNRLLTE